jgi:hypothetical protein
MLIIKKIWDFLKDQWFSLVIILVLVFLQLQSDAQLVVYENTLKELREEIKTYKQSDETLRQRIDSLSSLEKEVIKEIQTIKETEYVQIKVVDSMPISELQQFFTDRYPSSNSN